MWGCADPGTQDPGCGGPAGQTGTGRQGQNGSRPSASRRPASPDQRVIYTVLECQPLFDSSDMTITEWVQIAQTIEVAGAGAEESGGLRAAPSPGSHLH